MPNLAHWLMHHQLNSFWTKVCLFIGGACVATYLRFSGAILAVVVSNCINVSCCGFFLSSLKITNGLLFLVHCLFLRKRIKMFSALFSLVVSIVNIIMNVDFPNTPDLFLSDRCLTFGLQGHVSMPFRYMCNALLCGPLATPEKYPISVHSCDVCSRQRL